MNSTTTSNQSFAYVPPPAAVSLASQPRFEHGRNFSVLLTDDVEAKKDYVEGLLFAGTFMLVFFFVWSLLLIAWKFLGQRRMGFLSGHAFVMVPTIPSSEHSNSDEPENTAIKEQLPINPTTPTAAAKDSEDEERDRQGGGPPEILAVEDQAKNDTANDDDDDRIEAGAGSTKSGEQIEVKIGDDDELIPAEEEEESSKPNQAGEPPKALDTAPRRAERPWRHTAVRVVFILCGIGFIVSTILMVVRGVYGLETTVVTVNDSGTALWTLGNNSETAYNNASTNFNESQQVRQDLADELRRDKFCPNLPTALTTVLPIINVTTHIADEAAAVLDVISDLFAWYWANMIRLALDLKFVGAKVEEATSIDVMNWVPAVILIPYLGAPLLLILGAVLAHFNVKVPRYYCFLNWFVLPLFIVLVLLAAVMQGALAIAGGMNGDFCLPGGQIDSSPDSSVQSILIAAGYTPDTLTFRVAEWYVGQCNAGVDNPFRPLQNNAPENPLQPLQNLNLNLTEVTRLLELIDATFNNDRVIAELSLQCGRNFTTLQLTLGEAFRIFVALTRATQLSLNLFRCEILMGIYVNTFYDATCSYSPSAVFWMYCCTLVMSWFGMLMITLRASYKPTAEEGPEEKRDDQVVIEGENKDQSKNNEERNEAPPAPLANDDPPPDVPSSESDGGASSRGYGSAQNEWTFCGMKKSQVGDAANNSAA